jgi:hypothetical protein
MVATWFSSSPRVSPEATRTELAPFAALALGVPRDTDEEQSIALVGSADVGSSKARPSCVIPEFGQRPENDVEPSNKKCSHVLHDDESWS